MTARRDVLRWAGLLGAAGLAGCSSGEPEQPEQPEQAPTGLADMLLYETAAGTAVLDANTGKPKIAEAAGAVSANGRWLAAATPEGTSTRVTTKRTFAGDVVSSATLRGGLSTRAVSPDGRLVALVEGTAGDPYRPTGRTATTIVVADGSGERSRFKLPGCVEPEAFGGQTGQLYVLDYLPPTAPERYRVRMVDMASGAFLPLLTREKRVIPPGGEEEMYGEGRQAVFDGGLARLFTLYVHGGDHKHTGNLIGVRPANPDVHAFVHALAVNEGWAFCIDLPAPFGDGPPESHAIARSNNGSRLHVVAAASGAVAALDPNGLTVLRVGAFEASPGSASVTFDSTGERLFVAAGTRVTVLDAQSLTTVAAWPLRAAARGVGASGVLYVGQPNEIIALDMADGAVRQRFRVAGLSTLRTALTG
jgi:hypothetical protein